eukprot:GHVT01048586.1.p1 GENE.GHVT01048586.1~~GHVT01048586.1.p1  ORF type:complete len:145 (+),score=4.63 GHVT01048586.1:4146-4580(+)
MRNGAATHCGGGSQQYTSELFLDERLYYHNDRQTCRLIRQAVGLRRSFPSLLPTAAPGNIGYWRTTVTMPIRLRLFSEIKAYFANGANWDAGVKQSYNAYAFVKYRIRQQLEALFKNNKCNSQPTRAAERFRTDHHATTGYLLS